MHLQRMTASGLRSGLSVSHWAVPQVEHLSGNEPATLALIAHRPDLGATLIADDDRHEVTRKDAIILLEHVRAAQGAEPLHVVFHLAGRDPLVVARLLQLCKRV
jgi:hypothetical protein